MLEETKTKTPINQKIVPKGAFPTDQLKNFNLIKNYILFKEMYKITAPFRYPFLGYVVMTRTHAKYGVVHEVYHEASKRLIMMATQVNKQIGSKLVIRSGDTYEIIARLRGDFMDKNFFLFDAGFSPKKGEFPVRKQLAHIQIVNSSILSQEPSLIDCILANNTKIERVQSDSQEVFDCIYEAEGIQQVEPSKSQLEKLRKINSSQVYSVQSVKPTYCEIQNTFAIDLKGLIVEASQINSVLTTLSKEECLVMGKRSEKTFSLYVGAPLTLLQGFGIFMANKINKKL